MPDIEQEGEIDILQNGAGSLVSKYPICATLEALEGKTVPELAGRYGKVMKQYEGVEDETKTGRGKEWKEKCLGQFDIKDTQLMTILLQTELKKL